MDVVLWIIAAALAVAFGASGVMKIAQPKQKLAASGMGWVNDFSQGAVRAISVLEVLAAIGLVLPPLFDIAPVLTPLAALGLVLIMVGAAITHLRRNEQPMVIVNAVLGISRPSWSGAGSARTRSRVGSATRRCPTAAALSSARAGRQISAAGRTGKPRACSHRRCRPPGAAPATSHR